MAKINKDNNQILMDGYLISIVKTDLEFSEELLKNVANPVIDFRGITSIFS